MPEGRPMESIIGNLVSAIRNLNDKFSNSPKYATFLSKDSNRNNRLCDIDSEPHLFLIACLMDRQISAEKAWNLPFELENRIGLYTMHSLSIKNVAELENAMQNPTPLHRYSQKQAQYLWRMSRDVVKKYAGQANKIWAGCPTSAEVVWRLLEFDGIGRKIATMTANILVRDLKVKMLDRTSIDISVDTHVGRVFQRLGLSNSKDTDAIIYRARSLCPDYPGVLDLPLWVIGRDYCDVRSPSCKTNKSCPLYDHCQRKIDI